MVFAAGGPGSCAREAPGDVEGAHANGLPCVGVGWGIGTVEELREAGADALIGSPAELPGLIGVMSRP